MSSKLENLLVLAKKHWLLIIIGLAGIFWLTTLFFIFFYSRSTAFSYGGDNCFRDHTVLPALYKSEANSGYSARTVNSLSIKGYPVYSSKTCIDITNPPTASSNKKITLSIDKLSIVQKRYVVSTGVFPRLNTNNLQGKISIREPLKFGIDQADKVFEYRLSAVDQSTTCEQKNQEVICDISKLGLAHGKDYSMRMDRFFGDKMIEKVKEGSVTTVEPITIVSSSVAQGGIVYDSPTEIVLTTNKPLVSATTELLQDKQVVEHTKTIKDNIITLKLAKPMPRKAKHSLVVKDATAQDKGILPQEHAIPFTTSGGPKVVSANIGKSSVDPGRPIIIAFDQPLAPGQDITKQIVFKSGDTAVNYTASISGNQLILSPKTALPICSTFSITTTNNIISNHNITGDSGWSTSSRIRCYTTFTIGYSAQGKPINAWRFGSGPSKVMYVGNLHGDEKGAKYLLDSWIQELDHNAEKIPAHRTVIVIPSLNPDGFASSTRKNSRGVDLNRNFPAYDWKSDVKMPNGEFAVGGGGASPLSEPESKVLSSFVLSQRPDLILSYHSVASIVSANGSGNSGTLTGIYSQQSGYRNLPESASGSVFQYDTTGAFESWLYDKIGIPAILIELGSHTRNEFSRNKNAMWRML